MLFSDEIVELLAEESNNFYCKMLKERYGEDYRNIILSKKSTGTLSYLYLTRGISKEDIMAFVGIRIFMGIFRLPSVDLYWKSSNLYKNILNSVMSRSYFELISNALHFPEKEKEIMEEKKEEKEKEKEKEKEEGKGEEEGNGEKEGEGEKEEEGEEKAEVEGEGEAEEEPKGGEKEEKEEKEEKKGSVCDDDDKESSVDIKNNGKYDPRHKIQLYMEKLAKNFQKFYVLGPNITIDESLLHFKGRNSMKFYIPMKPYKWGFKIHLLCDSDTNYLYNMILDPGRVGRDFIYYDENSTLAESVVLRLLSCLDDNKQRNLFFDGWYSSLNLMRRLTKMGYLNTTVLRANSKELPPKLREGADKAYKDGILIQKYEGSKTIYFATNYEIDKEELRNIYNIKNRGVDTFDHYLEISSIQRRTKKWYKKILCFGIDASIINSKIICELRTGKSYTTVQYKEKIVEHIFKMYEEYKNRIGRIPNDLKNGKGRKYAKNDKEVEVDNKIKMNPSDPKAHNIGYKNSTKKCVKCGEGTKFICNVCDVYLHPECFIEYHKKVKNIII